jgi:DNA-binding MarR family transcriptional regulator
LTDRRQNAVTLSARGRKGLKAADAVARRNEEHVLAALTAAQRATLTQLLQTIEATAF